MCCVRFAYRRSLAGAVVFAGVVASVATTLPAAASEPAPVRLVSVGTLSPGLAPPFPRLENGALIDGGGLPAPLFFPAVERRLKGDRQVSRAVHERRERASAIAAPESFAARFEPMVDAVWFAQHVHPAALVARDDFGTHPLDSLIEAVPASGDISPLDSEAAFYFDIDAHGTAVAWLPAETLQTLVRLSRAATDSGR
jgi:hypothetical protein